MMIILTILIALLPGLINGQRKNIVTNENDISWLCDHHFKAHQNRRIEFMVKMEKCAQQVNADKCSKLHQCVPDRSFENVLIMCDDKPKYENVFNGWKLCLEENKFSEDEINQLKKCTFGDNQRSKRSPFIMGILKSENFDKFCEHEVNKYYDHHPEIKETGKLCMKKLFPIEFEKSLQCDKILNLHDIDVLRDVCEGKKENELIEKQKCEKEAEISDYKKLFECIREELNRKDWNRAARLCAITKQTTFNEFCATAWAAPWGNLSEHRSMWWKIDLNEARVNLETYIKRRDCQSLNMHLACKHIDKYEEDFAKMAECERTHKYTPEEMAKIKELLIAQGIDPLTAQLEITHETSLKDFCATHRNMMVLHDNDFSKEAIECAEELKPGMLSKIGECRSFCAADGETLKEQCKKREEFSAKYQEAFKCVDDLKPDSAMMAKIMQCAIKKIESNKKGEEEVESKDSDEEEEAKDDAPV